jgi:hypothetical protein
VELCVEHAARVGDRDIQPLDARTCPSGPGGTVGRVSEALGAAARLLDEAAAELELSARHCRTAAGHFRDGEVPRAGAHAWAAYGHVREAVARLDEQAREHARRSRPEPGLPG